MPRIEQVDLVIPVLLVTDPPELKAATSWCAPPEMVWEAPEVTPPMVHMKRGGIRWPQDVVE